MTEMCRSVTGQQQQQQCVGTWWCSMMPLYLLELLSHLSHHPNVWFFTIHTPRTRRQQNAPTHRYKTTHPPCVCRNCRLRPCDMHTIHTHNRARATKPNQQKKKSRCLNDSFFTWVRLPISFSFANSWKKYCSFSFSRSFCLFRCTSFNFTRFSNAHVQIMHSNATDIEWIIVSANQCLFLKIYFSNFYFWFRTNRIWIIFLLVEITSNLLRIDLVPKISVSIYGSITFSKVQFRRIIGSFLEILHKHKRTLIWCETVTSMA